MKPRYGLIGKNIGQSKSPQIYKELIRDDFAYDLLDIEDEKLLPSIDALFKKYEGINITSPYKTSYIDIVRPYDELTLKLGVINCMKKLNNQIVACNTDFLALKHLIPWHRNKYFKANDNVKFIILGDGSMSSITKILLDELEENYEIFSRRSGDLINSYDFIYSTSMENDSHFIINTCAKDYEIPFKVNSRSIVLDYNYPRQFRGLGMPMAFIDGTELLKLQAEYAVKFWKKST